MQSWACTKRQRGNIKTFCDTLKFKLICPKRCQIGVSKQYLAVMRQVTIFQPKTVFDCRKSCFVHAQLTRPYI